MARWSLLIALFVLVWSSPAHAADVSASLSADVVEVGEPFVVEMRAMTDGDVMPSDPVLRAPKGFVVSGPRISTRSMAQFGGGRSLVQRGIGATWSLVSSVTGTFTIPNPTVVIGGQSLTAGGSLRVKVVPAGQKPQTSPRGRSPFGGLFGSPFQIEEFEAPPDAPGDLSDEAKKLKLDREPDPYVFVRLVPDKETAVVGEQVTLSYYVYYRTDLQLTVQREPSLADFLRVPIEKAPGTEEAIITSVAEHRYHVKLLDRVAIFPLHAGELKTGVLFTKFTGRRFGAKELERTSNEAAVVVREPPLDGRPAGYRMGDVGNYKLSAEVTPRETRVGETVAVEVRLTGRGSLPTALKIPERTGVEWLDPERKEEIEVENGKVSGWRLFRYAVRFTKEGNTELGTVELPFFDEERGVYETASVDLGEVRILARKDGSSADTKGEEDPFATVAKPRQSLGEYQADRDRGVAPALLWTLVLVPPVGVTLSGFVWSVARGMRRRRRDRDNDPAVLARRALTELEPKTDPKDSAALAERALHLAIEAATGIKSRGVMLEELSKRLEDAGLAPELVADTTELLQAASKVRFDPEPEQEAADRVAKRAPAVVTRLLRAKNGKRSESKAA